MASRKASALAALLLLLAASCRSEEPTAPRVPLEPLTLAPVATTGEAANAQNVSSPRETAAEAEPATAALTMFRALTGLETDVMLELAQPDNVSCSGQRLEALALGLPPEQAIAFVVDTAVEGDLGVVILDVTAQAEHLRVAFPMQRDVDAWLVAMDPCGWVESLATSHAQKSAREGLLMLQVFWTDNGQYRLTQQDIDSYQPAEPEFTVRVGPAQVDPFTAVVLPGSDHAVSYATSTTGVTYCVAINSDGYIKWGAGALDELDSYEECDAQGSTDYW